MIFLRLNSRNQMLPGISKKRAYGSVGHACFAHVQPAGFGVRYVGVTGTTSIGRHSYKFNYAIILMADDRWYYCGLGRGDSIVTLLNDAKLRFGYARI
jgi:hypothetical protein